MSTGNKLIHVARVLNENNQTIYLFLRQIGRYHYQWFQEVNEDSEVPLPIDGVTAEEALRKAADRFQYHEFHPVECGFRYDLSERDEHGINALFYQMIESYAANNVDGSYFDPDAGHHCYVDFASDEALDLWHRLSDEDRL